MIEAFVTNLGKYNEGELIGEYLRLPTDPDTAQALLRRIGIDGVRYEEFFITDYKTEIPGLYDCLGEYENLDELGYLAALLEDMDQSDLEKFSAAVRYGEHTDGAAELINLTQNLNCYELYPEIETEEDLGRFYIEECLTMEVPEHLAPYFDYEAYGRDMHLNEDGRFIGGNYLLHNDADFVERYDGIEDIPDEYRITSRPVPEKASIRETLAACQQMVNAAPARDRPVSAAQER